MASHPHVGAMSVPISDSSRYGSGINGIDFDVAPEAATAIILGLAPGEIDEDGLASWIRDTLPTT